MKTAKKQRLLGFRKNRKTGKTIPITAPLVKDKKKIIAGKHFAGVKPKTFSQKNADLNIRSWIVTWRGMDEKQKKNPPQFTTQKELNVFLRKLEADGIKKTTVTPVHAGTAVEESKGGWIVEYFIKNREQVRGKFKRQLIKKSFSFPNQKKAEIFKKTAERVRGHIGVVARPEKPQTTASKKQYEAEVRKENLQVVNAFNEQPSSWRLELRDIIKRSTPRFKREMRVVQEFIRLGGQPINPDEPLTVKEIRSQIRREKKAGNTSNMSLLDQIIEEKAAIRKNEPSHLK